MAWKMFTNAQIKVSTPRKLIGMPVINLEMRVSRRSYPRVRGLEC
jgi:hypothetical protein